MPAKEIEGRSLHAWLKLHHPDVIDNYQEKGEFYVDVRSWGDDATPPTGNDLGGEPTCQQDTCWMFYNLTGYDLDGNVCITRNGVTAHMQGSFSLSTHYAPFMNYAGAMNISGIMEGTYLASRDTLHLSEEYVKTHPQCKSTEFLLRKGSQIRLYLPSSISYGRDGSTSEGGYEGQYTLDSNKPMIVDIEVTRVVKTPSDLENEMVDDLVEYSTKTFGKDIWNKIKKDEDDKDDGSSHPESSKVVILGDDGSDDEDPYYEGLYYTLDLTPYDKNTFRIGYMKSDVPTDVECPYVDNSITNVKGESRYQKENWPELEQKICDALIKRFGENALKKEELSDENLVDVKSNCKIWYIGRFLDGFIFDTNIEEVANLVFDKASNKVAISYTPDTDKDKYIDAWYLCIPKMHYGYWGTIMTTSGFAYTSKGVNGGTTTSSGNVAYDPSVYYNYYGYYNYYNSAYNYYDPYNYYGYGLPETNTGVTTEEINTEILPYTPMIFYIFIEKKKQ